MEEVSNGSASVAAAGETGPSSSSSTSHLHLHNEEEEEVENDDRIILRIYIYFTSRFRPDFCSLLFVCLALWFSAFMTMILAFYGSEKLPLGPYFSFLVQANSFFVQSIKLVETDGPSHGLLLFEFSERPPLEVEVNWSETYNVFVQSGHHMEWPYFLNEGSKVDISYSVKSPISTPLSLVIAQGKESLLIWAEDLWDLNTTLSGNIIYGKDRIQQDITNSGVYYIALGNLNTEEVEDYSRHKVVVELVILPGSSLPTQKFTISSKVHLNFTMKAYVYNTSQAYYSCSLSHHECSLKLSLMSENVAILTSPGPDQVKDYGNGYVIMSYIPRWITYFIGAGVVMILSILISKICNILDIMRREPSHFEARGTRFGQNPLLSRKDDDHSSWGSSHESITHEEEELDKLLAVASLDHIENLRSLCVLCFDASRDCFFLPCGHSAACLKCAKRVVEDADNCPICHRMTKKVRQIINV